MPSPTPSPDKAIEQMPMDLCPVCECVLGQNNIYTTKDVFSGEKHRWCKRCHTELEMSNEGWRKRKAWYE